MRKKRRIPLSDKEKSLICEEYLLGSSSLMLSKKFDISKKSVLETLKKNGISRRHNTIANRKYTLDYESFSYYRLGNEEQAYWVGFLLADGNVYHNRVKIGLTRKDENHLYKFLSFLSSDRPLYRYDKGNFGSFSNNLGSEVSISSKRLVKDLEENFGITPNKTGQEKPSELLKNNKHFWRGMIDGDGCLGGRQVYLSLGGSEEICAGFIDYTKNIVSHRATYYSKKGKNRFYQVVFTGRTAYYVIKELYSNCSYYLDRKYEIASDILEGGYEVVRGNGTRTTSRNLEYQGFRNYLKPLKEKA